MLYVYHLASNMTAQPRGVLTWLCLVSGMGGGIGDLLNFQLMALNNTTGICRHFNNLEVGTLDDQVDACI